MKVITEDLSWDKATLDTESREGLQVGRSLPETGSRLRKVPRKALEDSCLLF